MDAACLADCLCEASDVASALVAYERQQLDFGRLVRHSRTLGAELESRRSARDPARIIRDYGAPNILHDVADK